MASPTNHPSILRFAQSYKALLIFLIFTFYFFQNIPCHADISTGLVGWWKFDEASSGTCAGASIVDSSSNSDTGTCNNSPTWVAGRRGAGAMSFTAASFQYVSIGTVAALNPTNITITAWVKPSSSPTHAETFAMSDSGGCDGRWLEDDNGTMLFGEDCSLACNCGQAWATTASTAFIVGTWTFVAVTQSGASTPVMYVNGVAVSLTKTFGVGGQTVPAGTELSVIGRLGAYTGTGANSFYFPGVIDDVRVYNRVLTAGDILQLYGVSVFNNSRLHNFHIGT